MEKETYETERKGQTEATTEAQAEKQADAALNGAAEQETAAAKQPEEKQKHGDSFLKGFLLGIALVLLGSALWSFAVTRLRSAGTAAPGASAEQKQALDLDAVQEKLSVLAAYMDRYYLYEPDGEKVADGIYTGMLAGLLEDDPYANYYTKEELKKFEEATTGEYCGIGVLATQLAETKEMVILKVYENSPAEEAGILPGDILYKVNGMDVRGMDMNYVVNNMIAGVEGSWLDVSVLRGEAQEELAMRCQRRIVETPTVAFHMLEDGKTGYLALAQFTDVGLKQFKDGIDALEAEGMEQLVIDLRGNPGGNLTAVTGIMDYILPDTLTTFTEGKEEFEQGKTLMLYVRDKHNRGESFYAGDGHALELPIAVLIDGNSASAAELFSQCMKDYGKAIIVGTTSYGKGIAQTTFMLPDETAVEFTTDMYYPPSGYVIHEAGVQPDVVSELPEELQTQGFTEEEDVPLQAALEALAAQRAEQAA